MANLVGSLFSIENLAIIIMELGEDYFSNDRPLYIYHKHFSMKRLHLHTVPIYVELQISSYSVARLAQSVEHGTLTVS